MASHGWYVVRSANQRNHDAPRLISASTSVTVSPSVTFFSFYYPLLCFNLGAYQGNRPGSPLANRPRSPPLKQASIATRRPPPRLKPFGPPVSEEERNRSLLLNDASSEAERSTRPTSGRTPPVARPSGKSVATRIGGTTYAGKTPTAAVACAAHTVHPRWIGRQKPRMIQVCLSFIHVNPLLQL
jgi:hypothetical protein